MKIKNATYTGAATKMTPQSMQWVNGSCVNGSNGSQFWIGHVDHDYFGTLGTLPIFADLLACIVYMLYNFVGSHHHTHSQFRVARTNC